MARTYRRSLPPGSLVRTTVCQYCPVGCGYCAFLVPSGVTNGDNVDVVAPAFISPSMRDKVRYRGTEYYAAVVPDARCEINRGNHSVRGGTQGGNLVTPLPRPDREKDDRLRSPLVRCADGKLHEIDWKTANKVLGQLLVDATGLRPGKRNKALRATTPGGLGVKLFEYQYLENTYAATKLFYRAIGTPNLAYHDRPSAAGSSPGLADAGFRPHAFAYEDVRHADLLFVAGANPYENQSVFFMQNLAGKEMIVLDPRKTATAQYAVETGGLHLQPTRLGADSLVLFAMTRALLEQLPSCAIHSGIAKTISEEHRQTMVKAAASKLGEKEPPWETLRRASRALGLKDFKKFLGVGTKRHKYSLDHASEVSGIPFAELKEAVRRMSDNVPGKDRLPIVGTLYEKGLIWGFNYANTAAVAGLGLVLWRKNMPAPLTGRCGGHQKGWAEAHGPIPGFKSVDETGYPYANAKDTYGDKFLQALYECNIPTWTTNRRIKVRHNLDTHLFGPDETLRPKPIGGGRVELENGVRTCAQPDVNLLWIVGGNYLGQTHASQWKQARLRERLNPSRRRKGDHLPATPKKGAILKVLRGRIEAGGVVVVHQDIFPNATTELADIVLPAAGWGEDDFVRYNAERRLRLYERFQDPPLHRVDADALDGRDPLECADDFAHSPKPDWMIFRDVAREAIRRAGGTSAALRVFDWKSSAELADEMAQRSNRAGMMSAIVAFAENHGVVPKQRVHHVLGKGGSGDSELLKNGYSVPDASKILGNGVATNGILLPASLKPKEKDCEDQAPKSSTLEGTLRQVPDGELNFVRADWEEVEPWFERCRPGRGELAITCGRVNHLWNNLFNHIRNEHVAERYPEDLPGTVLEVNPDWADVQGLVNGQVVDVVDDEHSFAAVISRQDAMPEGTAFALFSFPVFDSKKREFTFDGYANNITFGYFDGINPIGALKYARGKIVARSPCEVFRSAKRLGPSYAQRNRIAASPIHLRCGDREASGERWSYLHRLDWRMRELIVARGLPRAFVHSGEERQQTLLDPDAAFDYLKSRLRGVFGMMLDAMRWPATGNGDPHAGTWDRWDGADRELALEWAKSVEFDSIDGGPPPPPDPDEEELERFFLAWSEHLTGFDDLCNDRGHARSLLRRLRRREPKLGNELASLVRKARFARDGRLSRKTLCELDSSVGHLAETITVLWYTGAFHNEYGFPAEETDGSDKGFGTLREDHYRRGLVWRATGLQPQGYSTKLERWGDPLSSKDDV